MALSAKSENPTHGNIPGCLEPPIQKSSTKHTKDTKLNAHSVTVNLLHYSHPFA